MLGTSPAYLQACAGEVFMFQADEGAAENLGQASERAKWPSGYFARCFARYSGVRLFGTLRMKFHRATW